MLTRRMMTIHSKGRFPLNNVAPRATMRVSEMRLMGADYTHSFYGAQGSGEK